VASAAITALLAASFTVDPRSASGALPPAYGGVLRLPAAASVDGLHPLEVRTPFDAALTAALYDTLYVLDAAGVPVPALASELPVVTNGVARISLRPGAYRHGTAPLLASMVVTSLRRAADHPSAAWLLDGVAKERGVLDVDAVDDYTIELRTSDNRVDIARLLSAAPLAIAVYGQQSQRRLGTGPFEIVSASASSTRLRAFRHAPRGAPYLDEIIVTAYRSRDEAIRAFELGELDGSWEGASLYGGRPVRPVVTHHGPSTFPVLIVRNTRGAVRTDDAWRRLAAAIDRPRLRRIGLRESRRLAAALPEPRATAVAGSAPLDRSRRMSIRLPIRNDDDFDRAVAEALAGMLDEHGIDVLTTTQSRAELERGIEGDEWDVRLATVAPPGANSALLLGAALVAAGQAGLAGDLARGPLTEERASQMAAGLDAIVIGHRSLPFFHRGDLAGVRFDETGRLDLGQVSIARALPRQSSLDGHR
jgi:MarR-like DNA-binding transcriptional regulator SgrR of sgrS sRNA